MNVDTDLTDDLAEAKKIQMGMLPADVPQLSGFEIAAHCTPASAVGGDFYDFIWLGEDRRGVLIGDAVGHGIAAALLMSMTLTDFRAFAPVNEALETTRYLQWTREALAELNDKTH